MNRYIKELATDIMLMTAAITGAVLMLTTIAAITHHTASTPQAAPATASRIVPCNTYLSHDAMVTENDANIPPVQHSFCYATGR